MQLNNCFEGTDYVIMQYISFKFKILDKYLCGIFSFTIKHSPDKAPTYWQFLNLTICA